MVDEWWTINLPFIHHSSTIGPPVFYHKMNGGSMVDEWWLYGRRLVALW